MFFLPLIIDTITISGRVIHAGTGEGIPGVTIYIQWCGDYDKDGDVDLHDIAILQNSEATIKEWNLALSQMMGPAVNLKDFNFGA
jgi:hypothetical protein